MEPLQIQMDLELIAAAKAVQPKAYAPFSQYRVGAALRSADGRVFVGVNVENPSYGLTICAERNAVGAAASAGVLPGQIVRIAVVVSDKSCAACGACRQVLVHWCHPTALLLAHALPAETTEILAVQTLLPGAFDFRP